MLLATMEQGATDAEARTAELELGALDALLGITANNDEPASRTEAGFARQMGALMEGASRTFGELTASHVSQCQDTATQGVEAMQQAVAGFEQALSTIGVKVDEAIASSLGELETQLAGDLRKIDRKIASEAWKAAEREQPAWKEIVAIVLVVLVIIAAAVISIVTLGAGASLFAIVLVGAIVGALSAGLIQIINNWASGQEWHEGVGQAMVIGAIGGAIGGGIGFGAGGLCVGSNATGDALWVVETAARDGGIGPRRLRALEAWASRNTQTLAGATTAFLTRRAAALWVRHGTRLAPTTFLWTAEDPAQQYQVSALLPGGPTSGTGKHAARTT